MDEDSIGDHAPVAGRVVILIASGNGLIRTPKTSENVARIITRDIVRGMRPGSVIVDVAIDQGGCAETSRPTTFDNPTYAVDGVIH